MKIEPRGKYAGVKVHLEPEEAQAFMQFANSGGIPLFKSSNSAMQLAEQLGKKLNKLVKEIPALLAEKTDEQIKAALEKEAKVAAMKLAEIEKGNDWKKVKA